MSTTAGILDLVDTVATSDQQKIYTWPDGPVSGNYKGNNNVPIANYIDWLLEVDSGLQVSSQGPTPQDFQTNCRKLRRMYYSITSRANKAGKLFDDIYGTLTSNILTTRDIPQEYLSNLYQTGAVVPSQVQGLGAAVDISHVFTALDWAYTAPGSTPFRQLLTVATELNSNLSPLLATDWDVLIPGLVTWLGDLASWFSTWDQLRKTATPPGPVPDQTGSTMSTAALTFFGQAQQSHAALDDLLGDMDGQILTHMATSTPTTSSLQVLFNSYYALPTTTTGPALGNRFSSFLQYANPAITMQNSTVIDLQYTVPLLTKYVNTLATYFVFKDTKSPSTAAADVQNNQIVISTIVNQWLTWVSQGASTNTTPPWPPPAS
jgi:hypothetical protein